MSGRPPHSPTRHDLKRSAAFDGLEPPNLRLALRRGELAQMLGMSDEFFDRYVRPHLKPVRLGSLVFYRPAEVERFLIEREEDPPIEVVER